MDAKLNNRPSKAIYDFEIIQQLRLKAISKMKSSLLFDDKIIKAILIGSSVSNTFGKYAPPGFRGSLYSDFDFILFVEDDYNIPPWLTREFDGKPFKNNCLNLAYRQKNILDNKYDFEIFFIRRSSMEIIKIQEEGELAGIPMTENSSHKYILLE